MKTLKERKAAARLGIAALAVAILCMPYGVSEEFMTSPAPAKFAQIQAKLDGFAVAAIEPSADTNKTPFPPQKPMHFKWLNLGYILGSAEVEEGGADQPLSGVQSHIYAQIFELQSLGEFSQTGILLSQIKDRRLMGHVLAQRYLHPDYRSSYTELANWMKAYADYPDSKAIYALAVSRRPADAIEDIREPAIGSQLPSVRNPVIATAQKQGNNKTLWDAALNKWAKGKYEQAADNFLKVAQSSYSTGWRASAGYYWAARSYGQLGKEQERLAALQNAAQHPYTFYGLLAIESLDGRFPFKWDMPHFTQTHNDLLSQYPAAKRAFALVAAGQYGLAESELLRLPYKDNEDLQRAVLAYAGHVGLPSLSMRLGHLVKRPEGGYYDAAMYPVTAWDPDGGYRLDPALVHAVIRQESRFDTFAVSHAGASGLMQIMPATAEYIAGMKNYSHPVNAENLHRPEISIKMGQDYLQYLLDGKYVSGDVVSLLAAYNAGPGNLHKWKQKVDPAKDPLFFIESIPVLETRTYVKKVMTNYWMYSLRAGAGSPSLLALSQNRPSRYSYVMSVDYPFSVAANR